MFTYKINVGGISEWRIIPLTLTYANAASSEFYLHVKRIYLVNDSPLCFENTLDVPASNNGKFSHLWPIALMTLSTEMAIINVSNNLNDTVEDIYLPPTETYDTVGASYRVGHVPDGVPDEAWIYDMWKRQVPSNHPAYSTPGTGNIRGYDIPFPYYWETQFHYYNMIHVSSGNNTTNWQGSYPFDLITSEHYHTIYLMAAPWLQQIGYHSSIFPQGGIIHGTHTAKLYIQYSRIPNGTLVTGSEYAYENVYNVTVKFNAAGFEEMDFTAANDTGEIDFTDFTFISKIDNTSGPG